MTKRFKIRPQDDYFGVNDCLQEFNVVNGIRTEIEAKWLCDLLNELNDENEEIKASFGEKPNHWYLKYKKVSDENEQLKQQHRKLQIDFNDVCGIVYDLRESKLDLEDENEQLKQEIVRLRGAMQEYEEQIER